MPRFYGKLYPGRLNRQELFKWRAPEQYEAIMTDLYLMGIITKEQFEQYNHRWILPVIRGKNREYAALPDKKDNYWIRDFQFYSFDSYYVDANGKPPVAAGTPGELVAMVAYNDGNPPQLEPPDPIGWYVAAWEWNDTDQKWVRPEYPQSIVAKQNHWLQMKDGTTVALTVPGATPADVPSYAEFEQNDYILPPDWIDVPITTLFVQTPVVQQQVNLVTGQHRNKPGYDANHTEKIQQYSFIINTDITKIYNGFGNLPLRTPTETGVPDHLLVLQTYPNGYNVMLDPKEVITGAFPTTGDVTKLYNTTGETTDYEYWDGSNYVELTEDNKVNGYIKSQTEWFRGGVDPTLRAMHVHPISFDGSYIINMSTGTPALYEMVPYPCAEGVFFIETDNGLEIKISPARFFDGCTTENYADGSVVSLQADIIFRYQQ